MKYIQTILIVIGFSLVAKAQAPKWIKYQNRDAFYPEKTYLRAFSSEVKYDNTSIIDLLEKCKDNAKKSLAESVKVSVKSMTISGVENVNKGTNVDTYEYIKQSSVSYSNIDIVGLKSETYYDKRKKIAYAFTYVKKTDLINYYNQKVSTGIQKLEQMYKIAENAEKSNHLQEALPKLYECVAKFREIEEAQSILVVMGISDDASIKAKKTLELKSKVDQSINELNKSAHNNISDLAYFISDGLKMQKPDLKGNISLSSFSYQDTKMASPFSKRLHDELEQKLAAYSNYNVINQNMISANSMTSYDYIITGTYWEENKYLKLILILRNIKNGKVEASIESKLTKEYCTKNSIQFKPDNFNIANTKNIAFSKNEIVGGDLQLEMWTNKGQENLLYSKNDTLKIYIRANKECYVRCVYYLADNSNVLLLDNHYIGSDKVNKVYRIPDEFICAEPFGVEMMQVNAQTEKFEPLLTEHKYGYDFITEDLGVIIKKNRGFKKIQNKEIVKAEKRLLITTMP